MKRAGLLAAAGIIVLTNAVVLLQVAHNRRDAVQTIRLTEREAKVIYQSNEDSGVSVNLNWRIFSLADFEQAWLDRAKLQALGFDLARTNPDRQYSPLARPAFVVLEYNGAAWEKWLKEAERPIQRDASEIASRLIPIDAARTAEPLLQKYSDRGRYLIVKGVIQLTYMGRDVVPPLLPSISQILPDTIHVPPPLSWALPRGVGGPNSTRPRYTLTLSYGRNFEPWIASVEVPPKN
jgi:hypothetical protein